MNAQQRRKAYRKIDRMKGKHVLMAHPKLGTASAIVQDRTDRVYNLSSTSDQSMFDSRRPSVHRVKVKTESGAIFSPRISKLRMA